MKIRCSVGKPIETREDCLNCALAGNNTCGYDYAVLRWLLNDHEQEKRKTEIHVTDITGCLRKAWYDKIDPTPEAPHESLARSLGTVIHSALEGNDEYLQSELPIERDGLMGTADIVYNNGRIVDFKTTRWLNPSKMPYGSHEMQVNIYAWMLRGMGKQTDSLAIQYVDVSGPTKCYKCRIPVEEVMGVIVCPQCLHEPKNAHLGALVVDVPLWDDAVIASEVLPRIDTLKEAVEYETAPEREEGFLCSYCAHRTKCLN